MDYEFKYRLENAPTATRDGSGIVKHRIVAISCEVGGEDWAEVPARRKDIAVPGLDLLEVLEGQDVIVNYKNLLVANLTTGAQPKHGWDLVTLEEVMDSNDVSNEAATEANEYITVGLGLPYPVDFTL